jgi:excisionase family DNA binding protein
VFEPNRFYSAPEVWRGSHAAREMVYEALRTGELRAIRRGRKWTIPGAEVIAWIDRAGK